MSKHSDEVTYSEEYRGHWIEIVPDDLDYTDNGPRDDDNLGTMACWHRRMNLGDEQPSCSPIEFMREKVNDFWKDIETTVAYQQWADEQEAGDGDADIDTYLEYADDTVIVELFNRYFVVLSINAYEHSGITISTGRGYPFNDHFDSGQLGIIYVSHADAMKNWGETEWTSELHDKTVKLLQSEVKCYDDYLTGNVYGYVIYEEVLDDEDDYEFADQSDSCWGFYPSHEQGERDYDYCLQEARSVVDWNVKHTHDKDMERAAQGEWYE